MTARIGADWSDLFCFGLCHLQESIADHMYRMGIITMLCPPEVNMNRDRCVKMALIHDMAEALVGDITPTDGVTRGMHRTDNAFGSTPR